MEERTTDVCALFTRYINMCAHPTHDVNDVLCCVKVDHTTGVYTPYSFRTVVWVLLCPTTTRYVKCC